MIAPTQHLPTIALHFDGSELRVTLRPEVKAERIGPGNRLTRVWPRDRLLPPSFIGNEHAGPTGHLAAECVLPHGYTWSSIFPDVEEELMALVGRFASHHWPLLEFAQNHQNFRDILRANPVLAYVMACNDEFRHTTPESTARRAIGYAERKQREILGRLGFPATEATVKLFKRIRPEAANPSLLRMLRRALPFGRRLSKIIAHAETINAGVLPFLVYPDLRDRLTASLLQEIASASEEVASATTADLVFDILRMGEGIPDWKGMPVLRSRSQVQQIHDRTLLEHLAHEERRRREREEHERRMREAQRQEEARRLQSAKKRSAEVFPDPPIPGTETIVPILSVADLTIEGIDQKNCVASRTSEIRKGREYIYRGLSPQRATLAISRKKGRWGVKELKRKTNAPASEQTFRAVYEWLQANESGQRPLWDDPPF